MKDQYFLMDCGEGTQVELRKRKLKFQKINQIFISHLHGDHCFGLIGLISTYHLLGRTRVLDIYGPVGLEELLTVQLRLSESHLKYELRVHEVNTESSEIVFENGSCRISSIPLRHRIACAGYLFEEKPGLRRLLPANMVARNVSMAYANKVKKGEDVPNADGEMVSYELLSAPPSPPKSYAYCSDTIYHPPVVQFIEGVDCLYHESTFLKLMEDRAKFTFHSTAAQAADIARMAGVKKLVLGHYSARYGDLKPFADEANQVFTNVVTGEDGMVIEV